MLWRAGYNTWEVEPVLAPELVATSLYGQLFVSQTTEFILGGFDLRAQAEMGVWRRLILGEASMYSLSTVFFLRDTSIGALGNLRAMTPKSLWETTFVCDQIEPWLELIKPDRLERSFAAVSISGILDPLMIGMPTEEAWDRFRPQLY